MIYWLLSILTAACVLAQPCAQQKTINPAGLVYGTIPDGAQVVHLGEHGFAAKAVLTSGDNNMAMVEVAKSLEGPGDSGGDGEKPGDQPAGKPGEDSGGQPDDKKSDRPAAKTEWRLPHGSELVSFVMLLGLLGMALRGKKGRQLVHALVDRALDAPNPPLPELPAMTPPPPAAVAAKPALRGIAGQYAGASIAIDNGPSVLGRDPHGVNLVFSEEADSISKRHCTVDWDAARRVFVIADLGSTNGTFLANGERLVPGQPRDLRPGERFYLGDLRNQFEVRLES